MPFDALKIKIENRVNGAGPNIDFLYDQNTKSFLHLQLPFLNRAMLDAIKADPGSLINFISRDDWDYLKEKFDKLWRGEFSGSTQFIFRIQGEERWLRVTPFTFKAK